MKKQMFAVVISSAMVLSLAACGATGYNGQNGLSDLLQDMNTSSQAQVTDTPAAQGPTKDELQAKYANYTIADGIDAWGDSIFITGTAPIRTGGEEYTMYLEMAKNGNNAYRSLSSTMEGSYGVTVYNVNEVEYAEYCSSDSRLENVMLTVDDASYTYEPIDVHDAITPPETIVATTYLSSEEIYGILCDIVEVSGETTEWNDEYQEIQMHTVTVTLTIERETGKLKSAEMTLDGESDGSITISSCELDINLPEKDVEVVSADAKDQLDQIYITGMYYGPEYIGFSDAGDDADVSAEGNLAPELTQYTYVGADATYNDAFEMMYPDGYTYYDNDGQNIRIVNEDTGSGITFYTEISDGTYDPDSIYMQNAQGIEEAYGIPLDSWGRGAAWNGEFVETVYPIEDEDGVHFVNIIMYADATHFLYIEAVTDDENYAYGAEEFANGVTIY